MRDRREEHIEHIRQSLENIKKEMYGMTYRPLIWEYLDEVLDDPHTLVIANRRPTSPAMRSSMTHRGNDLEGTRV